MTSGATAGRELRIRDAVRGLVIDPDQRVLLVRWDFPDRPHLGMGACSVWGTPGGGVEAGEDMETSLRRELREELGLDEVVIGPEIWRREVIIPFLDGQWDGQHDRCFMIETPAFQPAPHLTVEQLRAEYLMEIRWWTQDQLAAFAPTATEFFAPSRLPQVVRTLLRDGFPPTPLDVSG